MNKRYWVCALVVSLAALVLDFVIHGLLLRGDYQQLAASGFVRGPDNAAQFMPWMVLAHLLLGLGMTWLYGMASRRRPVGARPEFGLGLRVGAAAALLATIPNYLIHFAVQPWPAALVAKQILLGVLMMLALGLLLAWLQPARRAL